jgi:hypothetical protein
MRPLPRRRSPRLSTGVAVAAAATLAAIAVGLAVLPAVAGARRGRSATNPIARSRDARQASIRAGGPLRAGQGGAARPGPGPTSGSPHTPTTAADPQPPSDPEQVAAAFTAAFLTFRWDDPSDGLRRRCRPWDSDAVDAALAGPGVPSDRDRRAANHETDTVAIHAVSPQDRATDHLDASVAAIVTRERPGQQPQTIAEFLDLRVTANASGWAVDQVSQ